MRGIPRGLYLLCLGVLGAAFVFWYARSDLPTTGANGGMGLHSVLGAGGADPGFALADKPRHFVFPSDHGSHPQFRSEWWYFTGNLQDELGRQFGYQLTLFRNAARPPGASASPEKTSAWRAQQIYMAHLAVTDVSSGTHVAAERFARNAQGLAGVTELPLRVWLEDWVIEMDNREWRLRAAVDDVAIDLVLNSRKPPVLQGDNGLSVKSPGNASYYYSLTRMQTRGSLQVGGETVVVQGSSWLDREWSTSSLSADQSGWDWLSLQLDNGWDLMFYRLRSATGETDPHSAGVLVDPSGAVERLRFADTEMTPERFWESPDGIRYPVGWRLTSAVHDIDITVTPKLDDQEMRLVFRYWEGAVSAEGGMRGSPLSGQGFLELTGYGVGVESQSGQ